MTICPSCSKGCIEPKITSSQVLILKDVPSQEEIKSGIPFVMTGIGRNKRVENTTSYYLAREMGLEGLQFSSFSCTNFFMHVPPKAGKTKESKLITERCFEFSLQEVQKLTQNHKIIFMMGASIIKLFTEHNASDVYGLICKSPLLPDVPVIIPSPNSDKMMNQPIGEFRNAIKVLAEQIKILKQYQGV